MKYLTTFILKVVALSTVMLSFSSLAGISPQSERRFDVEVLIFKRTLSPDSTHESWPDTMPEIDLSMAGSLNSQQYRNRKQVRKLPRSSYELTSQKRKLDAHAGYKVLLHTAWQQGDLSRRDAPVFHIRAGKNYADQFNSDGTQKVDDATSNKSLYELEGKLRVYIQHYLFLESELDLRHPSIKETLIQPSTEIVQGADLEDSSDSSHDFSVLNVEDDNNTVFDGFQDVSPTWITTEVLRNHRFTQKRRMRSSETHYLDHPLMGIVIQVRRAP